MERMAKSNGNKNSNITQAQWKCEEIGQRHFQAQEHECIDPSGGFGVPSSIKRLRQHHTNRKEHVTEGDDPQSLRCHFFYLRNAGK